MKAREGLNSKALAEVQKTIQIAVNMTAKNSLNPTASDYLKALEFLRKDRDRQEDHWNRTVMGPFIEGPHAKWRRERDAFNTRRSPKHPGPEPLPPKRTGNLVVLDAAIEILEKKTASCSRN